MTLEKGKETTKCSDLHGPPESRLPDGRRLF